MVAFCVEFVFGFCVIGGSLVYESIPSCIYIFLVMIYMRQSVMMNKIGVVSKIILAGLITVISFGVLVAKGVGVYLFYKRSDNAIVPSDTQTYGSFGITIVFTN